ncbi:MAG: hypothetical protein H7Z74_13475 [Anaerolineae bacterium]|nr:hypothetical protein [Gemmatimonadaceae bacterium]
MHTKTADGALEVLALPFDPATVRNSASASANGAPSSQPRLGGDAIRDSAVELDGIFQRSRAALNKEAIALGKAERTSASYARSFDLWRERAQQAEKIRGTRDRLRAKLAASGLGSDTATDSSFPLYERLPLANLTAAARGNAGKIVRATLRNGAATLVLPSGVWWISLAFDDSTVFIHPQAISVEPAVRDTLRLPNP